MTGAASADEGGPAPDLNVRPDVVVVGDVMVDVSVDSGRLAPGGDVHGDVRIHPAGAGSNAAVWAASDGARVRLHGRVGDDLAGRLVTAAVVERGVETAMSVDPELPTGAMLVVRQSGERSMVADRGANASLSAGDLPPALEAEAVLLSGYLLFHPGSEDAARAALARARARIVAVDAASWPLLQGYGTERFLESTAEANLLLANEREADLLANESSGGPGPAAWRRLLDRFALVAVKRGPGGAVVLGDASGDVLASAPRVAPVDATGAGDAFDGVFLSALATGASMVDALRRACAAGAAATTTIDTWPPAGSGGGVEA